MSSNNNFEDIWLNFDKELTNFVRSSVNDVDTAKDIMQEIAIKIYKQHKTLREHKKLRGWLYRIAKNAIIDYFRVHHKKIPDNLHYELAQNDNPDEQTLKKCLSVMIDRLRSKDKEVLTLSQFQELSLKEVADELHISESGAKSRIQRSKKALSCEFFECCDFEINNRGEVVDYHQKDKACRHC